MSTIIKAFLVLSGLLLLLPCFAHAQSLPQEIRGLHAILDQLYDKMMPRCSTLIAYARVIGSFGATFYVGNRVWKHIANAEPIDFYPLMRPLALALCITMFPSVIRVTNALLSPSVTGTQAMVDQSQNAIKTLLAKREEEVKKTPTYIMYGSNDGKGNRDEWLKYTYHKDASSEGLFGSIGNDIEFAASKAYYNLKNWFKNLISFLLQLLYEAAALTVNTIRTFNLIICAMIGPLVFALSCYDGLSSSLTVWLARYINFYLWLPIANILGGLLGAIQEGMIELDLNQIHTYGDTFFSSADIGYLVFMIIGIVSYFTIPNIAAMIINPHVGSSLSSKVGALSNHYTGVVTNTAFSAPGVVLGGAAVGAGLYGGAFGGGGSQGAKREGASNYFTDKLKG